MTGTCIFQSSKHYKSENFSNYGGICPKENSTKVLKIKLCPVYRNAEGCIYTSCGSRLLVSLYMQFKWFQSLRILSFKKESVPHCLNIYWNKHFVRNFCRKKFSYFGRKKDGIFKIKFLQNAVFDLCAKTNSCMRHS